MSVRELPRGKVTAFTTRPVTFYGDGDSAVEDRARFAVVVAVVKTGSARALDSFLHFAGRYGLEWEQQGQGAERAAYGPDIAPALNASVTTDFLLWGLPEALLAFLEANTGDRRPIDRWFQPVTVRVASSAGSASVDDTCKRKLREAMRPREEREAREERARLNRLPDSSPDSPYHADRARLARFKAEQFLQVMWDTSVMREEELRDKLDRLSRFFAKHDRAPTSVEELWEETEKR